MSPARTIGCGFTTGCGCRAKNTRTCRTSEAEFLSCYAARSITENAAAAYLRICPERVDLSCNRALARNSAKDCQGLPMFNWRKHQHDPDVGNKVAIRRQLCVVAACAISVHKTMQDRVIKNSSAKNYATTLGKLGHCYFMHLFYSGSTGPSSRGDGREEVTPRIKWLMLHYSGHFQA